MIHYTQHRHRSRSSRHARVATAVAGVALATSLGVPACTAGGSGTLGAAPTVSPQQPRSTSSASTPSPQPTPSSRGTARTPSPGPSDRPDATPSRSPRPADPGSPGKVHTFQVWFVRDGALAVTGRSKPWTPAVATLAMRTLIAGPSAPEAVAGMRSPIRTDTTFSISVAGGIARVELPASFGNGGRTLARQRQAQVVYTLTQYPTISKVEFRINGVGHLPVGRADFAELLPAIVVSAPLIGSTVTSPVTVAGTANVFEATVSIRILNSSGAEVATTFTTATCGTGCRGSYTSSVRFTVARTQPGTIEVYEVSMQDGSRTHVVDIPVTLSP